MRFLIRLVLFWLISAPIFWFWGAPYLLGKLEVKTKADNEAACHQQLAQAGIVPAQVTPQRADEYCGCLNQALHFERADLPVLVQTHQLPPRLQAAMQQQVEHCAPMLQPPPVATPDAPVHNPDGSVEYRL